MKSGTYRHFIFRPNFSQLLRIVSFRVSDQISLYLPTYDWLCNKQEFENMVKEGLFREDSSLQDKHNPDWVASAEGQG